MPGDQDGLRFAAAGLKLVGCDMRRATTLGAFLLAMIGLTASLLAQPAQPLYENDFSKTELDQVPGDFLVIDGQFAVKQDGDNRFLELPGAPLETYGLLFGAAEKDSLAVARMAPARTAGLHVRRQSQRCQWLAAVAPARKALELWKENGS
jgi:hypothetical protein